MISDVFRNKVFIITLLGIITFVILHTILFQYRQISGSDNLENLAGAYSIAKYNTYAVFSNDEVLHPSAAREPLFPFILGMVIKVENKFLNEISDNSLTSFYKSIYSLLNLPVEATNQMLSQKGVPCMVNIIILFATIFLSCFFIYSVTSSKLLLSYAMLTLIFSAALAESAHTFLTEILSAFLCMVLSILLYYSKKWFHNTLYWICLGITVSALVLTKAIYLYFIPIIVTYLIWTNPDMIKKRDGRLIMNAGIFLFLMLCLIGSWLYRNHVNFGSYFIADRKAQVLMYRAEFDSISSKEYPYLFVVWAPGLSKYFLTKETAPYWTRLVNPLGNEQLVTDTYQKIYTPFFMSHNMSTKGAYLQPDSNNQKGYHQLEIKSIHKIMAHPLGHIKLSLAFLYRSFFVEDGSGLRYLGIPLPREPYYDHRIDSFLLAMIINLPVWFCFFYVMISSIIRKNWPDLALVLIPSYTVLVYSFLAFSHPRYMQPLIPILTIIFCVGIKNMIGNKDIILKMNGRSSSCGSNC